MEKSDYKIPKKREIISQFIFKDYFHVLEIIYYTKLVSYKSYQF